MVVRFSLDIREITPSRCKARNCRHGFYFDPVTFEATATPADAIFSESESPEKGDADGVDEVLCNPLSLTTADNKSLRSIDCWSSYCHPFMTRVVLIQVTQS